MQIDVSLKVDTENMQKENRVAYGYVELEGVIKFPVNVRKYTDKNDGKEKMFVSYPQKKTKNGYEPIIMPTDKNVKKEIEEKVLLEVRNYLTKSVQSVPIEEVRISLLQPGDGVVKNVGLATVKIAGCQISGIVVKEGQRGLFIQMPQHQSNGVYTDTVYATNTLMQLQLNNAVIEAYQAKVLEVQQLEMEKEQQLKSMDPLERFMECYEKNNMDGMLAALKDGNLEILQTGIDEDGTIEFQELALRKGEQKITVVFSNSENKGNYTSEIFAFIPSDKGPKCVNIVEKKGTALQKDTIYKEMLSTWKQVVNSPSEMSAMTPSHRQQPAMQKQQLTMH